jgi:ABC-type Fe3+ transport system permease subunit
MNTDMPPDDTRLVPAPQAKTPEAAYVEGVATGCFGCIGAVALAIIGFVAGCALVGVAHENEWFYTQEEFKNRHGLSDAGLRAWSNVMTGGLIGAVLFPIAGAATYALLRSHKNRGRDKTSKTESNCSLNGSEPN